jgi:hypothetical protein
MQLLITFKGNYADEFDVEGFALIDSDAWNDYLENLKSSYKDAKSIFWYFGSNQEIEFRPWVHSKWEDNKRVVIAEYSALDMLLQSYRVEEITDKEHEILRKLFHETEMGFFPWIGW